MLSERKVTRVLVVTPLGRGGQGGIDRIMDALADELRARPAAHLRVAFAVTRGQGHILGSAWRVAATVLRICGATGARPDLAHINLASFGSAYRKLVVAWACRRAGVPYILHLHGAEFDSFWTGARPALSAGIARMFAGAAAIVVLGEKWRAFVCAKAPEAAARVVVLPNATPRAPDRRAAPARTLNILFLGHLGPRKGVPELIEALASLRDLPNWSAIPAGNGDVGGARRDLAGRGLAGRVDAPGWVGPREVERLLARADILVLPSREENLPMSVIEGMAQGLAVVATPVGATPDIIETERNGLLVPPGDAPALAQALRRLIGDPTLRARLGEAAQAFHRERLDIAVYARRLAGLWAQVGAAAGPRPARAAVDGQVR